MGFFLIFSLCLIFFGTLGYFLINNFCLLGEIKLLINYSFIVCHVVLLDRNCLIFIFVVIIISSFVILYRSQYIGYKI